MLRRLAAQGDRRAALRLADLKHTVGREEVLGELFEAGTTLRRRDSPCRATQRATSPPSNEKPTGRPPPPLSSMCRCTVSAGAVPTLSESSGLVAAPVAAPPSARATGCRGRGWPGRPGPGRPARCWPAGWSMGSFASPDSVDGGEAWGAVCAGLSLRQGTNTDHLHSVQQQHQAFSCGAPRPAACPCLFVHMLAGIPTALSISGAMETRNLRIQTRDPVIELLSTSTIEALYEQHHLHRRPDCHCSRRLVIFWLALDLFARFARREQVAYSANHMKTPWLRPSQGASGWMVAAAFSPPALAGTGPRDRPGCASVLPHGW